MLLAVNVSNSQILLGGYDGSRLVFCARVHADRAWTADEYAVQFSRVLSLYGCEAAGIKGIIFSCVVPALAETVRRALAMLYRGRIYTVGPGLKTGLQMHMDDPAQLGGELVCCAVAARALGPLPCVAVLMDTAISMVALDKNGVLFQNGEKLIDDHTLVALTIMIAESNPEEKEMMISVIMNCLQ